MPTYSPPSLSTRTTRALPSGEIRPIAGAAQHRLEQLGVVLGQVAAVERRAARLDPEVAGDRPDRRRVVAGEHLQRDVFAGEEGDRLGRLGAQLLGQDDDPERPQRLGQLDVGARLGERRVVGGEGEDAAPGGGLARAARSRSAWPSRRCRPRVEQRLRGAEHQAAAVELERAPAPARGEGDRPRVGSSALRAVAERRRVDRLQGRVAGRRARRVERRRCPPGPPRSTPSAGISSTTRSEASVSVPVLSVHITETEASDSIAFSCWARIPCRAIFAAVTAAVSETSRISPSGTMFDDPRGERLDRVGLAHVAQRQGDAEADPERQPSPRP